MELDILRNIEPLEQHPTELTSGKGIYIVRLKLPSLQRISEGGKIDAPKLFQRLLSRAVAAYRLLNRNRLNGTISENKGKHLRQHYKLDVYSKLFNVESLFSQLESQSIASDPKGAHQVFDYMIGLQPTLYVGMAAEQPISARIEQHTSNLTKFATTLIKNDLDWSDCILDVILLNDCSKNEIRNWEKALQAYLRPAFSIF